MTGPVPDSVASHVAAVTLFGKPSTGFMNMIDRTAPPITPGLQGRLRDINATLAPVRRGRPTR
jgi:hypothetical protein